MSFNQSTSLAPGVMEEIEEKIAKGTIGKVLQDYANGDFKLSMWIPSELGES